ncbi:hypothetical protein [Anoxybacteroides tepidamans]|uniref:hypothetical protein n=1 Tax=Anoxybacteroides tepidamans TaxID=265948 RepID=UPI00068846CB|nr:hypothetical protein [Anoxybacillus tepidamans]
MKQLYKTMAVFLLGTVLISGCGTNEATETRATHNKFHEQNNKSNKQQQKSETARLPEKKLTYKKDGKTYEEMAYLKTSENQSFSLYVFKGWEFEAEEPNSDVLLKNDSFVRIRLIQPESGEMDCSKIVEDQAKAVSSDAVLQSTENMQGFLHGAVWYKAYTNDTAVNVMWIKANTPMIVSIQTPRAEEHLEPIFAMLETVEKINVAKPKKNSDNPDKPVSSSALPTKKTITYIINGQKKQETGSLYTSTNQPFRLYVLPNYQADAVEPHLDRIYVANDESYYMDVELLDPQADWNQIESETVQKLKEINQNVTASNWNESDPLLLGAKTYQAAGNNHWVQAFIIKQHSSYPNMRLTIHMPKEDASRFAELLAMARTIIPK